MRVRHRTLITERAAAIAGLAFGLVLTGCSFDSGGAAVDPPDAAPPITDAPVPVVDAPNPVIDAPSPGPRCPGRNRHR